MQRKNSKYGGNMHNSSNKIRGLTQKIRDIQNSYQNLIVQKHRIGQNRYVDGIDMMLIYKIQQEKDYKLLRMQNIESVQDEIDERVQQAYPSIIKYLSEAIPLLKKIEQIPIIKQIYPIQYHQQPLIKILDNKENSKQQQTLVDIKNIQKIQRNIYKLKDYFIYQIPLYTKYDNKYSKLFATYLFQCNVIKLQIKGNFKQIPQLQSNMHTNIQDNIHNYFMKNKPQFNSNFESGNLFQAYEKQLNQYDLIIQNDINTKGNNQWFFYSVTNVPQNTTIKFNILNLTKKSSLFTYGMKPMILSLCRYHHHGVTWIRDGFNIQYSKSPLLKQHTNQHYYCLSFSFKFEYPKDIVYFSYSIPYTATRLFNFLSNSIKYAPTLPFAKIKNIGNTIAGNIVNLLQISNGYRQHKKIVWIVARQHPGQATSGFMMEGIIQYLLSDCSTSRMLLDKFFFKIIPMVNIDGVIHGNSRAQLVGTDPNRQWVRPDKHRNRIIFSIKQAIEKDRDSIEMFLDLHSHSRKLGTFFYGNSVESAKIFPKLVCQSDERFTYRHCRFKGGSDRTARKVIFQLLGIPLVYTVESSFYGYQKDSNKIIEYCSRDYRQMGNSLVKGLAEYSKEKEKQNNERRGYQLEFDELDGDSMQSNSNASEDEFEQKFLRKILYKDEETINPYRRVKNKKKQNNIHTPKINKLIIRQSYYKNKFTDIKSLRNQIKIHRNIEMISYGLQVDIYKRNILKNKNYSNQKRKHKFDNNNLCIIGQKIQDDVTLCGNSVGVQYQNSKVFTQKKFDFQCQILPICSFTRQPRTASILYTKENNLLNRVQYGSFTSYFSRK